jgi:hypothetical protein
LITGAVKSQVDRVWDAFWSGGVSNPLSVIEQITYLLFARRLDEIHTARETQANLLGQPIQNPIFTKKQEHLRWSWFKDYESQKLYTNFRDDGFAFIKKRLFDAFVQRAFRGGLCEVKSEIKDLKSTIIDGLRRPWADGAERPRCAADVCPVPHTASAAVAAENVRRVGWSARSVHGTSSRTVSITYPGRRQRSWDSRCLALG